MRTLTAWDGDSNSERVLEETFVTPPAPYSARVGLVKPGPPSVLSGEVSPGHLRAGSIRVSEDGLRVIATMIDRLSWTPAREISQTFVYGATGRLVEMLVDGIGVDYAIGFTYDGVRCNGFESTIDTKPFLRAEYEHDATGRLVRSTSRKARL